MITQVYFCGGTSLLGNQGIFSVSGNAVAKFQSDGNFVVYGCSGDNVYPCTPDVVLVTSDTSGVAAGGRMEFQVDGNLVMFDRSGGSVWESGTYCSLSDGCVLKMLNDGNVAIYTMSGHLKWATGSNLLPHANAEDGFGMCSPTAAPTEAPTSSP
jgi:hypothetical protein